MIIGLLIALGSGVAGAGVLFPFLAMIVVLVWRPTGLFGGAEA
jgi:branched-subunit amino acid ABC-type transport system permease component